MSDKRNLLRDYGELLKVSEVAKVLRVSKMTVYNIIDADQLPAFKVRKSIRILKSDLLEYLGIPDD